MADTNPLDNLDGPDPTDVFGPDLELVAIYLAQGSSHAGAGLAVGRSAKWVQRALRETPALAERIRDLKEQRAAEAAAGIGALLEGAVAAVQRGLTAERHSDQLRAAALVFDQFSRFRQDSVAAERLLELQHEIEDIRAQLNETPAKGEGVAS